MPTNKPISFAYWVPNVSGGLVVSDIEQHTDWSYEYNKQLARTAENNGFALHPGLWHPGVLAKMGATADHLSNGRFAVNVASGWFTGDFTALGEQWLEHDERYRRSEEFITALKRIWTEDHAELAGDFYRIRDLSLKPKPLQDPHPTIFQDGNSAAPEMAAARVSDVHFMNGNTLSGVEYQVTEVRQRAAVHDREIGFALNGFMGARDSEAEAQRVVRVIVEQANEPAVEGFRDAVRQAGKSTADGTGRWQDSTFADPVQYNDGFRTGLVGTPEQIARRVLEYKGRVVDVMLLGFLHFQEEVEYFGAEVLPIVRELEREQGVHVPEYLSEKVAS